MKRHLIYPMQFDTRSHMLDNVGEHWDEAVKDNHMRNQANLVEELKIELGERGFDQKLANFKDLGSSPFSVVAHHNALFHQARYAFVHGFYYPALTSACALGERILNHLLLDLRVDFPRSTVDRKSHSRGAIDDWTRAIDTFVEWRILQNGEVVAAFRDLRDLRNRSLHFNISTVTTLREDALSALACLSTIIDKQFGFQFGRVIPGTQGFFFLSEAAAREPFFKKYYLHQSPLVSPYFTMGTVEGNWLIFDRKVEPGEITDEIFVSLFKARADHELAPTTVPWDASTNVVAMLPGGFVDVFCAADSDREQ